MLSTISCSFCKLWKLEIRHDNKPAETIVIHRCHQRYCSFFKFFFIVCTLRSLCLWPVSWALSLFQQQTLCFSLDIAERIVKVLSSFYITVHNRKWHVFLGLSDKTQRASGYIKIAWLCSWVHVFVDPSVLSSQGLKIYFPFLKSLVN